MSLASHPTFRVVFLVDSYTCFYVGFTQDTNKVCTLYLVDLTLNSQLVPLPHFHFEFCLLNKEAVLGFSVRHFAAFISLMSCITFLSPCYILENESLTQM